MLPLYRLKTTQVIFLDPQTCIFFAVLLSLCRFALTSLLTKAR